MGTIERALLVFAVAAVASGCVRDSAEQKPTPVRVCDFAHSQVKGASCNVSYIAAISRPEDFAGTRIFTYAYMWIAEEGSERHYVLSYEPRLRSSPDFASCTEIGAQSAQDKYDLSKLSADTFYSVSLAGDLSVNGNLPCNTVLNNVDFADVSLEVL